VIYFSKTRHLINKLILLLIPIFLITLAGCGGGGGGGGDGGSSSPIGGLTINWTPPTLNVDGTPLTDLAGYKIYYGPTSGDYTEGMADVGLTSSYDTSSLPSGYYCFVVVSYDTSGNESDYSAELCQNLI
jgi:hypothetical protein